MKLSEQKIAERDKRWKLYQKQAARKNLSLRGLAKLTTKEVKAYKDLTKEARFLKEQGL